MDRYLPFTKGPEHPAPVRRSETSKLASPEPLTDTELDALLHPDVCSGILSAVQLDAVALARKAHLEGGALVDGDGTGCGKARAPFAPFSAPTPSRSHACMDTRLGAGLG